MPETRSLYTHPPTGACPGGASYGPVKGVCKGGSEEGEPTGPVSFETLKQWSMARPSEDVAKPSSSNFPFSLQDLRLLWQARSEKRSKLEVARIKVSSSLGISMFSHQDEAQVKVQKLKF